MFILYTYIAFFSLPNVQSCYFNILNEIHVTQHIEVTLRCSKADA